MRGSGARNCARFKHDPRARLYQEYLRYVDAFQPLAVLMENVPDVLNHGGQNIAEEICEVLEDKGYTSGYTLLNAAYYGVPQMRERMFIPGRRGVLEPIEETIVYPRQVANRTDQGRAGSFQLEYCGCLQTSRRPTIAFHPRDLIFVSRPERAGFEKPRTL